MKLSSLVLPVWLLCAPALPAQAHEYWLSPSRFEAAPGDTVVVGAVVGTGHRGDPVPFAPTRALRFQMRAARAFDLTPLGVNGELTWARFVTPDAGGVLVAYESNFADIELAPRRFDDYLRREGLDGPLAERQREPASAKVHERYARCSKTWIAGADLARLTRPAGLTYELVPLGDPAGRRLELEARFRGRPLAGALVRVWNRPLGRGGAPLDPAARDSIPPLTQARTDARGRLALDLRGAGEWLVGSVHMIRSRDPRLADWESYWASLSFARDRR